MIYNLGAQIQSQKQIARLSAQPKPIAQTAIYEGFDQQSGLSLARFPDGSIVRGVLTGDGAVKGDRVIYRTTTSGLNRLDTPEAEKQPENQSSTSEQTFNRSQSIDLVIDLSIQGTIDLTGTSGFILTKTFQVSLSETRTRALKLDSISVDKSEIERTESLDRGGRLIDSVRINDFVSRGASTSDVLKLPSQPETCGYFTISTDLDPDRTGQSFAKGFSYTSYTSEVLDEAKAIFVPVKISVQGIPSDFDLEVHQIFQGRVIAFNFPEGSPPYEYSFNEYSVFNLNPVSPQFTTAFRQTPTAPVMPGVSSFFQDGQLDWLFRFRRSSSPERLWFDLFKGAKTKN